MSRRHSSRVTLLWGTIGALLFGALFASAGSWQLGRAAEKRALFADFDRAAQASPLEGMPDLALLAGNRYQPLRLSGRYDASRQVLLDSVIVGGQVGYYVLTPLLTEAGAVMVNRGFVRADPDRRVLPEIDVDERARTITGMMDTLPRPGIALQAPLPTPDAPWPRRLSWPDASVLSGQLGYTVPAAQLLLLPGEPDGYLREWRPALMSPETHLGYAVQWFGLLVAVIVVYLLLLVRFLRNQTK
ncbi:MAG: SURF1 family protein [Chromatiales bacterium]|nr:SURF1 family protein [Chromatiales bacterium]